MVGRQSPLNTSPPTHALVGGLTNGISTSPHSKVAVVSAQASDNGDGVYQSTLNVVPNDHASVEQVWFVAEDDEVYTKDP